MIDQKSNKYQAEKRDLKKRLADDIHVILSACLHQFEDAKELDEECFDVDAIVAGRLRSVPRASTRRPAPASAPYKASISRGIFIPHQNLFENVVRAHSV